MSRDLSLLPRGTWLYFGNISADTTEESLAKLLYDSGLDISPEHISVQIYRNGLAGGAIVSVPPAAVASLVNLAINQQTLGGKPVLATVHARKNPLR